MPDFMRFIKSEAGHVEKLYFAAKAASMVSSNEPTRQREIFLQLWNKTHPEAEIGSIRSAESHLSFARELGLLARRGQNRSWQLTNGFGRPFLILYEDYQLIPKNLLLASFMLSDKDILIPYLARVLNKPLESHALLFQDAWLEFYKKFRSSLIRMEPIVPAKLKTRTCRHHVEARDKFLMRSSGLGLNVNNLSTILKWLNNDSNLEDEIFLATSESISGSKPIELDPAVIFERISEYHKVGSVMSFASARGAWVFINELSFPNSYAKWSATLNIIQTSDQFMVQPSFDPKDRLFAIRGIKSGMHCI